LLKPEASDPGIWEAMVTPIKRLKPGEELTVETTASKPYVIKVVDLITGADGFKRVRINLGTRQDVFSLLSSIGLPPLPPYIRRQVGERPDSDLSRYQTVYATSPGAVAAPTAGLHFSRELLERLSNKGIFVEHLTLHVGPGTFKPIADGLDNHTIEEESFSIPDTVSERINQAKADGRRVIAVGTTSMRALETAAVDGRLRSVSDETTGLYIKPGYRFQIADGLISNFHLSRSSLLVLVSAFAGTANVMRAYAEAIERRYRFFSYGDAMLIL
jgi:S-adenosylmethionine:tRNA ribosyltransferase-isomerase